MIVIPDGATVADVVGDTDILAGQDSLSRRLILDFAQQLLDGTFDWEGFQQGQPMAFQQSAGRLVIDQGHHRWIAARLAGIEIPVTIEIRRDYWPGLIPFARKWDEVIGE